jgi:hypothetical protein
MSFEERERKKLKIDINEFKKVYLRIRSLVKGENDFLLAESHNIWIAVGITFVNY